VSSYVANQHSIPLALLGDRPKGGRSPNSILEPKFKQSGARVAVNSKRRNTPEPVYTWAHLHDALRRFVVPPFDGPWTQDDLERSAFDYFRPKVVA
jgi:hypothetical protein